MVMSTLGLNLFEITHLGSKTLLLLWALLNSLELILCGPEPFGRNKLVVGRARQG